MPSSATGSAAWWDGLGRELLLLTGRPTNRFGRVVEGLAAYSEVLLQREVSLVERDWGALMRQCLSNESLMIGRCLWSSMLGRTNETVPK